MTVDLGTGDGRAVIRAARADPERMVLGVDAVAASMRPAARRASRAGLDNAAFVVASAGSLPADLFGVADRVTVSFPWGSLLRGLVGGGDGDPIVRSVSGICRRGAVVSVIWSITPHDAGVAIEAEPGAIRASFERAGLDVVNLRPASPGEVAATGSSWAKRLGVGSRRGATLLRARKR